MSRDEDPEHQARLNESAGLLYERLCQFCASGRKISSTTMHAIEGIVRHHITAARQDGIKFPDMRVVIVEGVGALEIVRADLEHSSIQVLIKNISIKYPDADPIEIAKGIRRAFPAYHPRDPFEHSGLRRVNGH